MKCKICGEENSELKKCCDNCGNFLEGFCQNNVTGAHGYRTKDGDFLVDEAAIKFYLREHYA